MKGERVVCCGVKDIHGGKEWWEESGIWVATGTHRDSQEGKTLALSGRWDWRVVVGVQISAAW